MPTPHEPITLDACRAGVPYLDQYWGVWAIEESYARFLCSRVRQLSLQVHLEDFAPQVAAGASEARAKGYATDEDGIAHIFLHGTLMKHVSSMTAGTSLVLARRQVRAAAADSNVNGILLHVDSPGGTVAGTADLAADIRAAAHKKPVHARIEDCGASGAYWLASQAQRVSANPTALVGAIGVFNVVEDSSKAAANEGVTVHVIRHGAMKGLGTPGTAISDEQLAYLQTRVDSFADDFIDAVAVGRNLSRSQAVALADGRVHKANAAHTLGLIDEVESIDETMAALVAAITHRPTNPTRKPAMSASDTPTPTPTASENPAPVCAELHTTDPTAATIADLRAACVGATDSFILEQIEQGATLSKALQAHAAEMHRQNEILTRERDEARAKTAPAKRPRGVAPLAAEGESETTSDAPWATLGANVFLRDEIESRVAKGQDRKRATTAAMAAHPGLREAVVEEANARR